MEQAPSSIFMVRPEHFGFNAQTSESNAFQSSVATESTIEITEKAVAQFDTFVDALRNKGIHVFVFNSPKHKRLPDAVFPNNWVTFHEDGNVVLYPMLAENRRLERRLDIIDQIGKSFLIQDVIDLSPSEMNNQILEGSGSIVFDHVNLRAYANLSPRTDKELFDKVCDILGYEGVFFNAFDENGIDIFHTNVMMMIGNGYSVVCSESIAQSDKNAVLDSLKNSSLEIIDISIDQMKHFAGNMIQLQNQIGKKFLVLSKSAYQSLNDNQLKSLSNYNELIYSDVSTIEAVGGGSARCMIAGIHLQKK